MIDIETVYPNCLKKGYYFDSPDDYEPLIQSLEYSVITTKAIGSYQGDYLILFKDKNL